MTAGEGSGGNPGATASGTTAQPGSVPGAGRAGRSARRVRLVLVGVAVVLGVVQAAVWVMVAPVQRVKVYADGSWASLPTSDWLRFDALAIFVYSGAALGLIVAVAAWRIRAIRGVATLLAVLVGASASAVVSYGLATLFARGIDPASVGATGHESIVAVDSGVGTPLAMVVEPLVAVMVYTFLAAWDGRPDLGGSRARLVEAGTAADAPGSAEQADQGAEPVGDGHGNEPAADVAEGRP